MGSGASSKRQVIQTEDFEAIRRLKKETDLLKRTKTDTTALDDFIESTLAESNSIEGSTKEQTPITSSILNTLNSFNDYIDRIDKCLDKLQDNLNHFKEAVNDRCMQQSDDDGLRKRVRVRQQINVFDDVIVRAKERLGTMRENNTTKREIKDLEQQVNNLDLFRNELMSNGSLSARSMQSELSTSDFVVEDIMKWRAEVLTMRQEFETISQENMELKSDYERNVIALKEANRNLQKEIKELTNDVNKADETVEECEAKVQSIQETLLNERLSHEVEINSLKAIIETQDGVIARLTAKSTTTTPLPTKGDVRLSPEGFGGIDDDQNDTKNENEEGENENHLSNGTQNKIENVKPVSKGARKEHENEDDSSNGAQNESKQTVDIGDTGVHYETPVEHTVDNKNYSEENKAVIESEGEMLYDRDSTSRTGSNMSVHTVDKNNHVTRESLSPSAVDNETSHTNDALISSGPTVNTKTDDQDESLQNDIFMHIEGMTKEIMYRRNDGDIDGNLSYHKGVGAVLVTTNKDFTVDSISCEIVDELEINKLPDFVEGERVVSFQLHFQKKYGAELKLEEDETFSVFVPHRQIQDFEEASLIQSVDGGDWEPCDLLDERPTSINDDVQIVGTSLRSLNDIKLIVIAREKVENIVIEENNDDIIYQSYTDSSVTLKILPNSFDKRTELKFLVHDKHRQEMPTAVELHDECKQIVSCTTFVSITSEVMTKQDTEIYMVLPDETETDCKYTMFSHEDGGWKLADCDWNNDNQVLIVHLRPGYKKYRILGLEFPTDTSVEDRLLAVNGLHQHVGHHMVRLLFRQRLDDLKQAVITCISSKLVKAGIYELQKLGYSVGGYPSSQFCLLEGDTLQIEWSGHVIATPVKSEKMEMTFYPQRGIATKQLSLRYSDSIDKDTSDKQGCLQVMKKNDKDRIILGETLNIELQEETNESVADKLV
ncbi:hypothetical protein ACF0H5_004404 [Mactra antiquata]